MKQPEIAKRIRYNVLVLIGLPFCFLSFIIVSACIGVHIGYMIAMLDWKDEW